MWAPRGWLSSVKERWRRARGARMHMVEKRRENAATHDQRRGFLRGNGHGIENSGAPREISNRELPGDKDERKSTGGGGREVAPRSLRTTAELPTWNMLTDAVARFI